MQVRAILLAAIALFAASTLAPAEPAYAEVRIGAAGPVTGNNDWIGEQMLHGVKAVVEELNARGGVLGQQYVV